MNAVVKWNPNFSLKRLYDTIRPNTYYNRWEREAKYLIDQFYKPSRDLYLYFYKEENWGAFVRWDHYWDKNFDGELLELKDPLGGRT